jgi:hypothetical protein
MLTIESVVVLKYGSCDRFCWASAEVVRFWGDRLALVRRECMKHRGIVPQDLLIAFSERIRAREPCRGRKWTLASDVGHATLTVHKNISKAFEHRSVEVVARVAI